MQMIWLSSELCCFICCATNKKEASQQKKQHSTIIYLFTILTNLFQNFPNYLLVFSFVSKAAFSSMGGHDLNHYDNSASVWHL